jgi:PAS domain-containing protein
LYASAALAEDMLSSAIETIERGGGESLTAALDALPAPIYVTDPDGVVTHFNQACIGFAGRTPAVGKDRWCVTWKLYTDDGEPLAHDCCPMAAAIREKQPIRGVIAQAERPNGERVVFMPFPTPLLDADGTLRGAINMLIDVTDFRQAAEMRAQVHHCLRLAATCTDRDTARSLITMAVEYEAQATALERDRAESLGL